MLKYFIPLFLSFTVDAQVNVNTTTNLEYEENTAQQNLPLHKYVSLQKTKVYDVELIIFAYRQQLPNQNTYLNKFLVDESMALSLQHKPDEVPFILSNENNEALNSDINNTTTQNTTNIEYTVSIEENPEDIQVLAWFEHTEDQYKLTPIWRRLEQQENIVPLLHKSWRQGEAPFDDPIYIKINNNFLQNNNQNSQDTFESNRDFTNNLDTNVNRFYNTQETNDSDSSSQLLPDFDISGMVALSQGRFMHFGNKLKLNRLYNDQENEQSNMTFSLVERRQIKSGELHYFDSPWFGSIVKVTEYKGQQENENTHD